jgi:hypothetical protein
MGQVNFNRILADLVSSCANFSNMGSRERYNILWLLSDP